MFRELIVLASLIGALAFAPSSTKMSRTSSLKMNFEGELGVTAPVGFFDPLGKRSYSFSSFLLRSLT